MTLNICFLVTERALVPPVKTEVEKGSWFDCERRTVWKRVSSVLDVLRLKRQLPDKCLLLAVAWNG